MAGKSNYLENLILNLYNGTGITPPATFYLALYTSDPTDADSGTEVSGGAYARVAITANTTNFPTTSDGSLESGAAFDFGTATANWGTVTHWALRDAAAAGNMWHYGTLSSSKTINSGDDAQFGAGDLVLTED